MGRCPRALVWHTVLIGVRSSQQLRLVERSLLSAYATSGWSCSLSLQSAVHSLQPAVDYLRMCRLYTLSCNMPSLIHHTDS